MPKSTAALANKNKTESDVNISETSQTSSSLLRLARKFDDGAWAELVETFGERIYRWALQAKIQPHDATDLTQEVFASIARKIDVFRREKDSDSFRKWIRIITKNKIRDYWRARKGFSQPIGGSTWQKTIVLLEEEALEPSGSVAKPLGESDPRQEVLEQVKAEVSNRDWTIFERLVVEDRSAVEVADEFDVKVNVVYLVKSRLLKRLRNAFARRK